MGEPHLFEQFVRVERVRIEAGELDEHVAWALVAGEPGPLQHDPHAVGERSVPPVGGWIMCINKHSDKKEAAWDYMKWFASPEVHKDFVLAGGPPSRHSAMKDADIIAAQPWVPVLYESSKAAWAELRPRHALTFEMIDALGLEVNRAIVGDSTPQEAMDAANENITKMLKREGLLK